MKPFLLFTLLFLIRFLANAQTTESSELPESRFRFAVTYGISPINPGQLNDHIGNSNYSFGSNAPSIKSLPELGGTISFHPANDFKVIVLRAGMATTERIFNFTLPQTTTSPSQNGTIAGSITETYSVYPFSMGVGGATPKNDFQFQVEFIYALSTITEKGTYQTSDGIPSSYTRTLTSPTYGLRVCGSTLVKFSDHLGLVMELSYRYLNFDEFEDEKAAQYQFLEFPVTGITASMGMAFTL